MARLIKVGTRGGEVEWKKALKDVRADDVLLLEPGFYQLDQGLNVADITIKGMGNNPEDTVIEGYFSLGGDCRFFNLENIAVRTKTNHNAFFIEQSADTYLTLRNAVIESGIDNTAAIAGNGKCTIELFSVKILGASISLFKNSSFRLTMNDCYIDYPSTRYAAIGIQGKGTAIISNSIIKGNLSTYFDSNSEVDLNNSQVNTLLIHGQTWMNLLNTQVTGKDDGSFYVSDESWINVVNCSFAGGVYFDKKARAIIQNSQMDRLIGCNEAKLTLSNTQINSHADFQDEATCNATRVAFSGGKEFEYFLALNAKASLTGNDIILNPNQGTIAIKDDANITLNVLTANQDSLEIECEKPENISILGIKWAPKTTDD